MPKISLLLNVRRKNSSSSNPPLEFIAKARENNSSRFTPLYAKCSVIGAFKEYSTVEFVVVVVEFTIIELFRKFLPCYF